MDKNESENSENNGGGTDVNENDESRISITSEEGHKHDNVISKINQLIMKSF